MHKNDAGISVRVCDRLAVSGTAMAVSSITLGKIFHGFQSGCDELDIELCSAAQNAGLRNVFNPHAQAVIENCFKDSRYKEEFFKDIPEGFSIKRDPFLNPNLKELSGNDSSIKIIWSDKNSGIAENTNRAISMAKGDFVVFCDHDDKIELFALEVAADYINRNPDADVLYSDEDMIDERGIRHSPRLQPDWNSDMLLSHMYCPHLVCFKTSLVRQIGNLNPHMDGAQEAEKCQGREAFVETLFRLSSK